MEYNSNLQKLIMPEYGRNIQNMVSHIMTIENRDERQRAAQTVIDVMGNLYTYLRDIDDFKHKLWDHLAIMSDFKLDIDYPYEIPQPEMFTSKPKIVPYNTGNIKYRHYGIVVQKMIKRTAELEEGAEKDALVQMIADHMKKCYLTWNKETVDDIKVMADFQELSKGRIDVPQDFQLKDSKDLLSPVKKKKQNNPPKKQFKKR
jgi:hypothetical protein